MDSRCRPTHSPVSRLLKATLPHPAFCLVCVASSPTTSVSVSASALLPSAAVPPPLLPAAAPSLQLLVHHCDVFRLCSTNRTYAAHKLMGKSQFKGSTFTAHRIRSDIDIDIDDIDRAQASAVRIPWSPELVSTRARDQIMHMISSRNSMQCVHALAIVHTFKIQRAAGKNLTRRDENA